MTSADTLPNTSAACPHQFMAAAVTAILVWATPRARRQIDVLVAVGAWFSATVLVMLGNLRVDRRSRRRGLLAHANGLRP